MNERTFIAGISP